MIGTAKAGTNPDAIAYDPATQRVFAMNGRSEDSTAIDAKSGEVVGTIPLDGKPEFEVADGRGHIYANLENKSEVVQIDSKNLKVTATLAASARRGARPASPSTRRIAACSPAATTK